MTHSISYVGIIHNTAEFPYTLAANIAHWAQVSGKFTTVKCMSYRRNIHALLLPLVGNSTATFHPAILAQQMPWQHAERPKNRTKYATVFIETTEALEYAINRSFLDHAFMADVRQQIELMSPTSSTGVTGDCRLLFVITDIRSEEEMAVIKTIFTSGRGMFVRAVGNKDSRASLKCAELDGSFVEQFYTRVEPARFSFMVDNTSSEADLEAINTAVLELLPDDKTKNSKTVKLEEMD